MSKEISEKQVQEQANKLFQNPMIQELAFELLDKYGITHLQAWAFEDMQHDGVQHSDSARSIQNRYYVEWTVLQDFRKAYKELYGKAYKELYGIG